MSIQFKVPLYILFSFILNIVFIGLYYHISLSETISDKYMQNHLALESKAFQIARNAEKEEDYRLYLHSRSEEEGLLFEVRERMGGLRYTVGAAGGVMLNMNASSMFEHGGETLLLKVTEPISLGFMSSFNYITDLFIAEFFIISFTLLLLWLILYINNVRPLVELNRSIRLYKSGFRPEHTRRRDEIGLLQNGFAELAESLDEEKKLQHRIIASISHDIKTPLTSVMGYAERLKNENLGQERRAGYIHTIYEKSCRIKETVDDFDEYVGLPLQPMKRQSLTASALCGMLDEEYRGELAAENVGFHVTCEAPEPKLDLDIARIRRVFGNIIGNSLKYSPEHDAEIRIRCYADKNSMVFEISDNGPGVPTEALPKLFEPFYTSDQSRRAAGLGLSICRSIAESHGGSIRAENGAQGGLCIVLRLPLSE